jgi:hypothetical protein
MSESQKHGTVTGTQARTRGNASSTRFTTQNATTGQQNEG